MKNIQRYCVKEHKNKIKPETQSYRCYFTVKSNLFLAADTMDQEKYDYWIKEAYGSVLKVNTGCFVIKGNETHPISDYLTQF